MLTLGLVITVQTTYVFSQLPGTPVFYKQFAGHLAWTTGNAGCALSAQPDPHLLTRAASNGTGFDSVDAGAACFVRIGSRRVVHMCHSGNAAGIRTS